jgi:hypothetical protein
MSLRKLESGTYSDRGDRNSWTYWDTYVNDGSLSVRMFQLPWSGAKTRDLTNMKTAGLIPANQNFKVTSIGIQFLPAATAATTLAAYAMLAGCVGELIINGKDASYQKTLFQMIGGVFGIDYTSVAGNTLAVINVVKALDRLPTPIVLAANVPFEFDLTFAAAAPGVKGDYIKVLLNGRLVRAM